MTTEKWNPGHSTNKGYPFSGIVSRQMFKNRPETFIDENNKSGIAIDAAIWGNEITRKDVPTERTKFEDFLLHRLRDFSESLKIAEDQIDAILEENPFLPEDFGFKIIHQPDTIHESPIRIYGSKFDESISIYREMGDVNNPEFDYSSWVLVRVADGNTSEIKIKLPCHRIAYAVFYSLGIKIELTNAEKDALASINDPGDEDITEKVYDVIFKEKEFNTKKEFKITAISIEEARKKAKSKLGITYLNDLKKYEFSVTLTNEKQKMSDFEKAVDSVAKQPHSPEDKPKKKPGYYTFDVVYTGPKTVEFPEGKIIKLPKLAAKDKNDSLTRAKFLIETNLDYNVDLVKFEELESTLVD